ncbi:MAG: DNA repair protein RecO [Chloroflexi bacterium]|nr:DNA repair protein RecO [Chloroflexota bacterium]
MNRTYATDAIILRRAPFGDHGALMTVFTADEGKIPAIARGVHRPASRWAGHFEPLALIRVGVARGRNLDVITQAQVQEVFPRLRSDLYRTTAAWYAAELIDRLIEERQEARRVFELFLALLRQLNGVADPDILLAFFEMRLLALLGYRPALWHCTVCNAPTADHDGRFAAVQGGWICSSCAHSAGETIRLSPPALRLLRRFQVGHLADFAGEIVPRSTLSEASRALREVVRVVAERYPRTLDLLDRLRPRSESDSPVLVTESPAETPVGAPLE